MPRKKREGKDNWLIALLKKTLLPVLLSGGVGFGGFQLRDHPVLAALIRQFTGQSQPGDPSLAEAVAQKIAEVKPDPFKKPGDFRVELVQMAIDPATIQATDKTDIRVVVVHYGDNTKREVLWQSAAPSSRFRQRDKDSWIAAWEGATFPFRWMPGDRIVVEVWERRGLRPSKAFEYASASSERFPLAPGDYPLTLTLKGAKPFPTDTNTITFDARPADERPGSAVARGDSDSRSR